MSMMLLTMVRQLMRKVFMRIFVASEKKMQRSVLGVAVIIGFAEF